MEISQGVWGVRLSGVTELGETNHAAHVLLGHAQDSYLLSMTETIPSYRLCLILHRSTSGPPHNKKPYIVPYPQQPPLRTARRVLDLKTAR